MREHYLRDVYIQKGLSAKQISVENNCSENKVHYWLKKFNIPKRSIGDATYRRANPNGDPFLYTPPSNIETYFLFGLGLGLFWGEGNKANKQAVRLGNSDPTLIYWFIHFLNEIFNIQKDKLRFGLQIFTDTSPEEAQAYWCKALNVNPSQFHKTVITKQHKKGTYHRKLQYGVLTVYFSNRKLRDMIVDAITKLQNKNMPM